MSLSNNTGNIIIKKMGKSSNQAYGNLLFPPSSSTFQIPTHKQTSSPGSTFEGRPLATRNAWKICIVRNHSKQPSLPKPKHYLIFSTFLSFLLIPPILPHALHLCAPF
jgi:hypothetical protein